RGVHAPRNGPSADGKCWQRIELGIHSLKSRGRNWKRKIRETRSSSLCSRISRELLAVSCCSPRDIGDNFSIGQQYNLSFVSPFDLNYLRKICGTWVQAPRNGPSLPPCVAKAERT